MQTNGGWIVQAPNPYSLASTNTWAEFPNLKIYFDLTQRQPVRITYNITTNSHDVTHLCTSIYIDNKEHVQFRAISGNTHYHTNTVSDEVVLDPGNHAIAVQYRTPGNFTNLANGDWNVAILKVTLPQTPL